MIKPYKEEVPDKPAVTHNNELLKICDSAILSPMCIPSPISWPEDMIAEWENKYKNKVKVTESDIYDMFELVIDYFIINTEEFCYRMTFEGDVPKFLMIGTKRETGVRAFVEIYSMTIESESVISLTSLSYGFSRLLS